MNDGSRKSAALYTLPPEIESGLSCYGDNAVERRSTACRAWETLYPVESDPLPSTPYHTLPRSTYVDGRDFTLSPPRADSAAYEYARLRRA